MQIITNTENFPAEYKGSVIAIGNFDGVHRGHKVLLEAGIKAAKEKNVFFGVLTFEPHPRSLFRPDDPPFRITPALLKFRLMEEFGADFVVSLPFNWEIASKDPEDFIDEVLLEKLEAAHIIVGENFRFGQLRKGSPEMIVKKAKSVDVVRSVTDSSSNAYSSSRIRYALRHGRIGDANDLLGWEWQFQGEIIHGDKRGRELGYPTANVLLDGIIHPGYGVYAAFVKIVEEGESAEWRPSAVNIGIRPMFELSRGHAEAHIFDFEQDIYGQTLIIKPVSKIRGEAKFPTLEQLIEQIDADCEEIKSVLKAAA